MLEENTSEQAVTAKVTDARSDYDPMADLAATHPGWIIHPCDLGPRANELIDWDSQTYYIAEHLMAKDPVLQAAHAVAHLDLHGDCDGGRFTEEEEREATRLAQVRLSAELSLDDLLGGLL